MRYTILLIAAWCSVAMTSPTTRPVSELEAELRDRETTAASIRAKITEAVRGSTAHKMSLARYETAEITLKKARASGTPQERVDASSAYMKAKQAYEAIVPAALTADAEMADAEQKLRLAKETLANAIQRERQLAKDREWEAAKKEEILRLAEKIVEIKYDKFEDETHVSAGPIFFNADWSRMSASVSCTFSGRAPATPVKSASLLLSSATEEWQFVRSRQETKLILLLDSGTKIESRCSHYDSDVKLGGVNEYLFFDLSKEDLKAIAMAKSVEAKLGHREMRLDVDVRGLLTAYLYIMYRDGGISPPGEKDNLE